jgi:hypothetical protein
VRSGTPVRGQSLPAGTHHLTVEKKGYQLRELAVQLGAAEQRTLDVELRRVTRTQARAARPTGLLTVKTVPWAKVFDGSRLLGTTPMAQVPLAEGTHVLKFVNPDLPPVTRTITVRAGEEAKISIELKP